jgi:hypothetical protein
MSDPARIHAAHLARMANVAPPFTAMQDVYSLLAQLVAGTLHHPTHRAHKQRIFDTLRSTLASTRTYVVSDQQDLHAMWASVRNDPPTFDFLMDLNNQLLLALAASPLPFETLVGHLSAAFGAHKPTNNGRSAYGAVDQDLLSRLPDPKAAKDVMLANPWFVTLVLLSYRADLLEG